MKQFLSRTIFTIIILTLFPMANLIGKGNNEIANKIKKFETGLSNKNINLAMSVFDKNAKWKTTPTYKLVRHNLLELFDYYSEIKPKRISYNLEKLRKFEVSTSKYLIKTKNKNDGEIIEQHITFKFLWAKKNSKWKVIATNLPQFKKSSSEKVNYNFSSEIDNLITGTHNKSGKQIIIKSVADAYVYAYHYRNWNRSNRGKYEQLVAGWHPVGGESRIYIRFELPDFSLGKTEKVYLRLYHFSTSGNSNVDLGVYRVGDPWKEGKDTYHPGKIEKTAPKDVITWKHQPVFNSSVIASFNPGTKQNHWVDVDITVLVREWQAGFKNYGLVIKPVGDLNSSNPESLYHFASREYENGSRQPVLVVKKANGNTVGVNNQISNTKIVGDWKWFTGDLVHIYKNRTVKSPNGSHGTWKTSHDGSKLIYIINWENGRYIDKLVLKGNTLDGHNQNGTHVWGKRIKHHKLKSGTYHVTQGNWESTWRLKVEKNGKITGTSEWTCCPNHRVDPMKGRITGNTVEIKRDCSGQGYSGACNQTYKGKIVGDRIEGTCSGTGLVAGSTWTLYLK